MNSTSALSLHLTPMQLPESADLHRSQASSQSAVAARHARIAEPESVIKTLVLRPGEPSEFVVRLRNMGDRPMQLALQVEGDFPLHWCRIGSEGHTLLPNQTMEAVLYFEMPADWFEDDRPGISQTQTPNSQRQQYSIDRVGRLCVNWLEPETGRRQIEWAEFRLAVRPRSVYLNFLPGIYQEIDFVGRFLKIFEESFEPTVQTLDLLWAYLDPLTAPESLLPFLSHWVAWEPTAAMSPDRQRRFIRHAIELYRWRGTKRGLRFYLHLATGLPLGDDRPEAEKPIAILESFGDGLKLGATRLGDDALLGGGKAFHFIVQLTIPHPNPDRNPDREAWIDEPLIRQIINQEKPAFCTYDLQIISPPPESIPPPIALNPSLN